MNLKTSEHPEKSAASGSASVRCAVLTVSDSSSPETDYGGRTVAYQLVKHGHAVVRRWIVPFSAQEIDEAIVECFEDSNEVDAMILIGGTGFGAREHTYEVLERRLEKRLDAFTSIFAYLAFKELGSAAISVRAIAGTIGRTLFVGLPSAESFCELAMDQLVIPELSRTVAQARR